MPKITHVSLWDGDLYFHFGPDRTLTKGRGGEIVEALGPDRGSSAVPFTLDADTWQEDVETHEPGLAAKVEAKLATISE